MTTGKGWRRNPDDKGHGGTAFAEAVRELYRHGQTDYSFEPLVRVDGQGQPAGRIQDGDAVIFCCRRGEREIQLTEAFVDPEFNHFPRQVIHDLTFVILTLYHDKFKELPIAFAPTQIHDTLGEVVSRAGLRQLRVAESEKYSHITFFLNGSNSQPFNGEDQVRIPSPQGIPFDQVPELSLTQVVSEVVCGINQGYDLIVTNFANGDVIGHTQNQSAKLRCAEFVDTQLGRVMNAALAADYAVIITADHGNLEEMFHPDGSPHVAHTANLVPFTLIDPRSAIPVSVQDGKLSDVAPTVLHALGLVPPKAMHGVNLAPEHNWGSSRRVLLLILDGWGIGKADVTNPIFLAQTPAWDDLAHRYPGSRLQASGEAVGLQPGKPGNSEAGHINIGAGRVVLQDDMRLDLAMKDGSFFANETLLSAITKAKQRCGRLHLLALLSENSSHGSMAYPLALLEMAKSNGLKDVYMHIIFDGRSTEPGSAPALLENLESKLAALGIGQIVSGMGRCLALDRDSNYGKTQRAYDALVLGIGKSVRANEGGSPC